MAQVITFEGYRPSPRFDSIPWTEARVEEATTEDGPWTQIDVFALSPVDSDPEHPASRSFTTELASDTPDLWYRIVFADGTGDVLQPTTPVQNAGADATFPSASAYADVDELARILKIRAPSADQTTAMERVLLAAAGEINSEIGRTNSDLAGWQLSLAQEVNLERAVEHWRQEESPFGLVGLGAEMGSAFASKDSWERHALKLAPLKDQWGLA